MHNRSELVNKDNPCRCLEKIKGFIANGWVNPRNLKWHSNYTQKIIDLTEQEVESSLLTIDDLYARLYKKQPFKISINAESIVENLINNESLRTTFDLAQ